MSIKSSEEQFFKKRLYEEQIVKKIVSAMVIDAIDKKITKKMVGNYIKENFSPIVKELIDAK